MGNPIHNKINQSNPSFNNGEHMFYLFEIAYKFGLTTKLYDFYELTQVIAKDFEEAKKTIVTAYSNKNILEVKLLKITPIPTLSPFINFATDISNQIYNQFECIEKKL